METQPYLMLAGEYVTLLDLGREEAERRGLRLDGCPAHWDFALVDTPHGDVDLDDCTHTRGEDGSISFHRFDKMFITEPFTVPGHATIKLCTGRLGKWRAGEIMRQFAASIERMNAAMRVMSFEEYNRQVYEDLAKKKWPKFRPEAEAAIVEGIRQGMNDPNRPPTDMDDE